MKLRIRAVIFFLGILTSYSLHAQVSIRDSSVAFGMFNIEYSLNAPGGDFADRFGLTNALGASIGWKLPNNFYALVGARGIFGSQVKDSVGWNIMTLVYSVNKNTYDGLIPGSDGKLTEVRFWERGLVIPLTVGKIFPVFSKMNPNSGLYVEGGFQYFRHKIHFEVIGSDAPALDKQYRKGYDRLSYGLGLVQGFGLRYFSSNKLVNFHIGMEFSQNFTKNRRSINFDTGQTDFPNRVDLLYGIKAGWTYLLYKQAPQEVYYY